MAKNPILTHYVSEVDRFLQSFDQQNPVLSLSQLKEKEKYARIYFLRDEAERPDVTSKLWEGF